MKTLYDVLTKEEKKAIRKEFKDTKKASWIRLIRIRLTGLLILAVVLYLTIANIVEKSNNYYFYLAYILFAAAGIFFIYESYVLRKRECNRILKNKKQNKKS